MAQGRLGDSLACYRNSLEIRERLVTRVSGELESASNTDSLRDLAERHDRICRVLVARNDLPAALKSCHASLEIRQRQGHASVVAHLAAIPEVLEIHSITGVGDLIVRVVARNNADLGRVIDRMIDDVHVIRANTSMCLVSHLDYRTGPLVDAAATAADAS